MAVLDSFEHLLGRWSLSRHLDDPRTSTASHFSGEATWSLDEEEPGGLRRAHLLEVGTLASGTYEGEARRSLLASHAARGPVELFFSDGRYFANLDLRGGPWSSTHLCAEDVYEITTIASGLDTIEERWRVRGPAKDYEALSVLTRC